MDDYEMSNERIVSAKMDVFRNAARELTLDFWTEYWEIKGNKKLEENRGIQS